MFNLLVTLTVFLIIRVTCSLTPPCLDSSTVDCARADETFAICRDPVESVKKCPQYCKLCPDDERSTNKKPKFRAASKLCINLDPTCEDLHNISHYCENFHLVRKLCPKACNSCYHLPKPQCIDESKSCKNFTNTLYCQTNHLIKILCPVACGICDKTSVTTESTISTSYTLSTAVPNESSSTQATTEPFSTVNTNGSFSTAVTSGIYSTALTTGSSSGAVTCRTCEDPYCNMGIEAEHKCPAHAPFCMNIVGQDKHNIPKLTKRCADENLCKDRWLKGSAMNTLCMNLNLNFPANQPFECTYCCITSLCNIHVVPRSESLYTHI